MKASSSSVLALPAAAEVQVTTNDKEYAYSRNNIICDYTMLVMTLVLRT
jgi:hypothetical protein